MGAHRRGENDTPRVVRSSAQLDSYQEIAKKWYISVETFRRHQKNLPKAIYRMPQYSTGSLVHFGILYSLVTDLTDELSRFPCSKSENTVFVTMSCISKLTLNHRAQKLEVWRIRKFRRRHLTPNIRFLY